MASFPQKTAKDKRSKGPLRNWVWIEKPDDEELALAYLSGRVLEARQGHKYYWIGIEERQKLGGTWYAVDSSSGWGKWECGTEKEKTNG